jgi:hypothetical protein
MKTLCIVACHSDSNIKIESLKQSRKFLQEITDDIIYVNSIGCTSPFSSLFIENTKNVCYDKYLHVLNSIDLEKYDNYILTNDSIFIIDSLVRFKELFDPNVEMTSLIESTEINLHYPDFLRRYNQNGIKKIIQFYKDNLKNQTFQELILDIELKCHLIHNTMNVLYKSEKNFHCNIHFDNVMLKKYLDNKYPILKIKKLMEFKYVSYPLFLFDYNKQLNCNFDYFTREFDVECYKRSYSDLSKNRILTEHQALQHWTNYGKYEGRKYFFNWIKYLNDYPDLRQNGIHTEAQSIQHWLNYGKNENRIIHM